MQETYPGDLVRASGVQVEPLLEWRMAPLLVPIHMSPVARSPQMAVRLSVVPMLIGAVQWSPPVEWMTSPPAPTIQTSDGLRAHTAANPPVCDFLFQTIGPVRGVMSGGGRRSGGVAKSA